MTLCFVLLGLLSTVGSFLKKSIKIEWFSFNTKHLCRSIKIKFIYNNLLPGNQSFDMIIFWFLKNALKLLYLESNYQGGFPTNKVDSQKFFLYSLFDRVKSMSTGKNNLHFTLGYSLLKCKEDCWFSVAGLANGERRQSSAIPLSLS